MRHGAAFPKLARPLLGPRLNPARYFAGARSGVASDFNNFEATLAAQSATKTKPAAGVFRRCAPDERSHLEEGPSDAVEVCNVRPKGPAPGMNDDSDNIIMMSSSTQST